jgi:MGT family glycosyltransferase
MMAAKRFLMTMWDGGGNVPPLLGVARRLIARGHEVRVLGDPTLEREARGAGCAFSPWTTAPHRQSRDPKDDVIRDYEAGGQMKMIGQYMREFLGGPAPRWADDTLRELEARPVDVFLADQLLPATTIAAEKLGLPRAALSPNIWMIPTPGIPPLGPGFGPEHGVFARLRNALIRRVMTTVFNQALPSLNEVRRGYGLPEVRSTYEQMLRVDATCVLTSPRFDFTSPSLPAKVHYVGPILDDPAWAQPLPELFPGDDRPLVLVGLSSTFQDQARTLGNIIAALSSLPVRAIVTTGEALAEGSVAGADNVRVLRSAPHSQILPRCAALVTHCGHGTTMKGLTAGVPLLCLPMGRDQNDTAARVVAHGAGLRLAPTASSAKIAAALQRLLGEARFKKGAEELGAVITSGEGCADLVEVLERLAPAYAATFAGTVAS